MKLFRIVASAQGGRAFQNMGSAWGMSDEMAAQIVRYFLPVISRSIQKRAQTAEGLISVLEFLGSRRFDRFLDDPRVFGHPTVADEGERVLDYVLGSRERIRKIVARRAEVLNLPVEQLEKLFPYIAVLALGAIEIRTRRPLGSVLHRINNGSSDSRAIANPYLALAQLLRKKEREEKDQRRRLGLGALRVGNVLGLARPSLGGQRMAHAS
jgi:hypothetical protein